MHKNLKVFQIRRTVRCLLGLLLMILITAVSGSPIPVKAEQSTVRVAVWVQGGRYLYNGDTVSGYDVELIEKIAEKCNWEIKYVYVSGIKEALMELDHGNADLITSVGKREEWISSYLYSGISTGWEYNGLIKLQDRTDIIYQDVAEISKCTIGYAEDYDNNDAVLSYLHHKYGDVRLCMYPDMRELRKALEAGEIDLMAAGGNDAGKGEQLADRFSPSEVYYLTSKSNTALMNQLDEQLADLTMSDPGYFTELQIQYFPMYLTEDFTKEELDYIASAPALKVGIPKDRIPVAYYDEEAGNYTGIATDLMDLVARYSGLSFEYIGFDGSLYTDQALQQGDYDLIVPALESSYYDNPDFVSTTNTLLSTAITIAVKKGTDVDELDNLRVGVAKEFANIGKYMKKRYPHTTLLYYDSQQEVLDAANKGKVTAILNSVSIWSYLLQNPKYAEYSLVPTISVNIPYCIAAANEEESLLLISILNKTINRIDESERNTVLAKYTTGEVYRYTLTDRLIDHIPYVVLIVLIIVVFIIFYIQKIKYYRSLEGKNRKLLEANQAKNEFLSRMSHEIRTPMNAILGLAALGKEDAGNAAQVESSFAKIESSGEFLLGIINDILDMSRIENATIELHEEFIYQPEFLESVVTMILPIAMREKVELVYDFSHAMPVRVKADRLRLQQICINLLNNAVKFSEEGSKVEWLTEDEQIDETHIRMKYTIRDYGCGMSEEFLQKLFLPFVQEYNKFSDTHTGSGLGLAIVKNIVEQMEGTITVSSKLNEGTEFVIELVREMETISAAECKQNQAAAEKRETIEAERLTGKRVLLVEDNEINREVAGMMLERYGITVEYAENGHIAVEKVTAGGDNYYDIILMDIHMPVMNGLESTKAIRALNLNYAAVLPIVAMTANTFDEDKRQTMEAGMNAHLAKPIDRKLLLEVLLKYGTEQEA